MHFLRVTSQACNLRKTRVFSFKGLMWQIFKHILISSFCLPRASLKPKTIFTQNPINFKLKLYKIIIKVCPTIFLLFHLDYAENFLGFINLVIFEKGVGIVGFCQNLFKFLIGLCPICLVCVCVGPMWQFWLVFRQNFSWSCIAHMLSRVLHIMCLIKYSSDIFELFWTPMSSKFWDYSWLNLHNMF